MINADYTDAYINGGDQGYELVVHKYNDALLKYCHSILCNYHDAQDALQIVFIKAYDKRASFGKSNKISLNAFLYKIAYNTCIDILRKRKFVLFPRYAAREEGYISEPLRTALLTLPDIERAVVYSHAVEQLPFAELAEMYGKTPAALRKRYERAKKKLAAALADEYPRITENGGVKNEQNI